MIVVFNVLLLLWFYVDSLLAMCVCLIDGGNWENHVFHCLFFFAFNI